MNRLYRLWNVRVESYGRTAFALCPYHSDSYNPPVLQDGRCKIEMLGPTTLECNLCSDGGGLVDMEFVESVLVR